MLTKLPDYIISDCGYPNWNKENEELNLTKIHDNFWNTSSIWSRKSTKFVKLLPLRETLTDYYMEKLMMTQNQSMYMTTPTKDTQNCKMNNKNCERLVSRYANEVIKNGKRKQHQQKQEIALDKRRSYTKNLDKDLDQF